MGSLIQLVKYLGALLASYSKYPTKPISSCVLPLLGSPNKKAFVDKKRAVLKEDCFISTSGRLYVCTELSAANSRRLDNSVFCKRLQAPADGLPLCSVARCRAGSVGCSFLRQLWRVMYVQVRAATSANCGRICFFCYVYHQARRWPE